MNERKTKKGAQASKEPLPVQVMTFSDQNRARELALNLKSLSSQWRQCQYSTIHRLGCFLLSFTVRLLKTELIFPHPNCSNMHLSRENKSVAEVQKKLPSENSACWHYKKAVLLFAMNLASKDGRKDSWFTWLGLMNYRMGKFWLHSRKFSKCAHSNVHSLWHNAQQPE